MLEPEDAAAVVRLSQIATEIRGDEGCLDRIRP